MRWLALLLALLLPVAAVAQVPGAAPITQTNPPGVPASGGTFTGAINFGGSGISTGLPTNGVYLNSANQCLNTSPAIGLTGKDGTPLLEFLSSEQVSEPPSDTIGLGYGALAAWTCASSNGPEVALGTNALGSVTTGDHNIAVGNQALHFDVTGAHNTAVGIDSVATATAPAHIVALGEHTLTFAVTPSNGVFVGEANGFYLGTTNQDTAIGFNAMEGLVGNSGTGSTSMNVAVGYDAMVNVGLASAENTSVGAQSLSAATFNANFNTALGYQAGNTITTGGDNVLLGASSGSGLTTGSQGIFILGTTFAAANAATGTICIGNSAVCGGGDTVIGHHASASQATNGSNTTAVGNFALNAATGTHNTAFGFTAGQDVTSGGNNLILGYQVESNVILTGSNNVFIGTSQNCVGSGTTAAEEIDLCGGSTEVLRVTGAGTPATSTSAFAGNVSAGAMVTGTGSFVCATAGSALTLEATTCVASDERLKNNIDSLTPDVALARVLALPSGHDFTFKGGYGATGVQEGFFAQEVQKTRPDLVTKSAPTALTPDGTLSVNYPALGIEASLAIKALQSEIDAQRMWLIVLSLIVLALGGSQVMLWRRQ